MPDEITTDEESQCEIEEKIIDDQLGRGMWKCVLIVAVMALLSPLFYGKGPSGGDLYGFLRTIFETGGPSFIKAMIGIAILRLLENGLKGCWTRRIYDANYGPVILYSVFLYCVLK
jgi:hypothetical protein